MATTLPAAPRRRFSWNWLGLVPFFAFSILFIFLPSASLFIDSFQNRDGQFTLENIAGLFQPPIPASYLLSIQISLTTALMGGLLGFLMAYALTVGNLPRWLRAVTLTFAGRGLQLCRRAAGLCLYRHAGSGRLSDRAAAQHLWLEHLRHRLQPLQLPGVEPGLHVLPVSRSCC
jgi:hypothetical protein